MPRVRPLKESDTLKAIVDFLEARKILYVRVHPIRLVSRKGQTFPVPIKHSQVGAPDLLIFPKDNPPRCLAVEAKAPGGKQTPDQVLWQERAERVGVAYLVVENVDVVMRLLGENT